MLSLTGDLRDWIHSTGPLHPWYHLALFGALGFLGARSSRRTSTRLLWLAVAMLLGLGIEYAESIRYVNPLEWSDVLTDCGGVALGAVVSWTGRRWRRS